MDEKENTQISQTGQDIPSDYDAAWKDVIEKSSNLMRNIKCLM